MVRGTTKDERLIEARTFASQHKQAMIQRYRRLSGCGRERKQFEKIHGYPLNLERPVSFNEKLAWRKLYDRNPLFPVVVDKLRVRDFVVTMLGEVVAKQLLVPMLCVSRTPKSIPFDDLPANFVLKANHGSGMNVVVSPEFRPSREEIIRRFEAWMRSTYGAYQNEWAYARVPRRIVGEELISLPDGRPPSEVKLHMFEGECRLIQTLESDTWYDGHDETRGPTPFLTFFTPDWERIDFMEGFPASASSAPDDYADMLKVAEELSRPFDYIRVDFYVTSDGFRLGELTPYPGAGSVPLVSANRDFELGRSWRLPTSTM